MDFFSSYMWIIGLCVVIILAVIGFIADKTNFIDKQSKKRNSKKTEETVNNTDSSSVGDLNRGLNDAFVNSISQNNGADNIAQNTQTSEDVFADLAQDTKPEDKNEVPSELFEPLGDTKKTDDENIPSDLYEPIEESSKKPVEESIPSDLYEPLEGSVKSTEEKNNDSEVLTDLSEQNNNQVSTDEQVVDFSSTDDDEVWKF